MDISAGSFRDKTLISYHVLHDWDSGDHTVDFSVQSNDGKSERFRLTGLTEVYIADDFNHGPYIEFCSFIRSPGRLYISFDPYNESVESDQDNFCFVGLEINSLSAD